MKRERKANLGQRENKKLYLLNDKNHLSLKVIYPKMKRKLVNQRYGVI